ncbi:TPA: DUF4417 domain-containing protein [Streptococcus agalactiae]|nr:DUF4417 domain-containing protein [Streptococcus agalactiae]
MNKLVIEYVDIDSIKPYQKNARLNDGEAVEKVAGSIKEFGFQQPILVDENNVIITGHTRLKAALSLGIEKVPIAHAVNLTDDQIKAYRLADNRVAEFSMWDFDLLESEIEELTTIDMSKFGFDLSIDDLATDANYIEIEEDEEIPERKEHHRDLTINQYNLFDYDEERTSGKYNMPTLSKIDHIPPDLQGFNYVLNNPNYSNGVHFFLDDYQFERIWQKPDFYIEKLIDFDCVLTPDFSLYLDMPIAMQIWNIYRSRLIGQMMQDLGLSVIPTVSWSTPESFDFCFDGLPTNGTLAISTIGIKRNDDQYHIWKSGVDEMIKRLSPKNILVYGGKVEYDYKNINVVYYNNSVTERMKSWEAEEQK